jgi:hypothetical protein
MRWRELAKVEQKSLEEARIIIDEESKLCPWKKELNND